MEYLADATPTHPGGREFRRIACAGAAAPRAERGLYSGPGAGRVAGYLFGSDRIATAPEPNSSRLTSFKSTRFDSPANNVGPWPTSLGCTTNSYSSLHPHFALQT